MEHLTDYAGMDALDVFFPETTPIDANKTTKSAFR